MSSTGTSGLEGVVRLRPDETSPRPEATWDESIVIAHDLIGDRYHRLVLHAPSITARARAGQFVMVTVPSSDPVLLPRPMAIHRRHLDTGALEIIFNVVGRGTEALARSVAGDRILLTGPLGRGFEIPESATSVLVIGRGIGVCAVMGTVEDAAVGAIATTAVLSAATRDSVIGIGDCVELGADAIVVSDDDGSSAIPELEAALTAAFDTAPPSVVMVCGSSRLTRLAVALGRRWDAPVQVSLEAHMACGLGYCHGCAAPVATAPDEEGPLVCLHGPVFDAVG